MSSSSPPSQTPPLKQATATRIARRFESFDVALLPINAVTARLPGFAATSVPASLTPEQAVEAAFVLRADRACAIHHGLFHNPPGYVETDAVVTRFRQAAEDRGIEALTPRDGEAVVGWE
jgi:L-ascorbate metabolism protein UlaG (beta-lactamase superfamily)